MPRTLLLLFLLALTLLAHSQAQNSRNRQVDILRDTFAFSTSSPSDYDWDEIYQGCAYRDCIPSIDQPKFLSAQQASFLSGDDIVVGVTLQGQSRAYPIRILVRHELVNDSFNGAPILVSYCPLCGSALVFDRRINGEAADFGVSGLLHNSDLIMYDRDTESLWQQITGAAFAGQHRGQKLQTIPSAMTSWSQWLAAHPNTSVLSTNTGYDFSHYTHSPYGDYASSELLMFPVTLVDARKHPKMNVFGVEINGQPVAYDAKYLSEAKKIDDEVAGIAVQVRYGEDGLVTVSSIDSEKQWTAHRMFWFAWYAFHPDTLLREAP